MPKPASRSHKPHKKSLLRKAALTIRNGLVDTKKWFLIRILNMDLHPGCRFSLKAQLDFTNPRGVHVGEGTYLAFGSVVLSHDMSRLVHCDTYIGRNCFVGAHAIVLPGVVVGDNCIVGSGAVVTKDVPPNSLCAGNPARVIRSGIKTREWGILIDDDNLDANDGVERDPLGSSDAINRVESPQPDA
ncbi:MAG: DapH/DapD/GlmU-related protein [Rubripirellula sp.]